MLIEFGDGKLGLCTARLANGSVVFRGARRPYPRRAAPEKGISWWEPITPASPSEIVAWIGRSGGGVVDGFDDVLVLGAPRPRTVFWLSRPVKRTMPGRCAISAMPTRPALLSRSYR